MGLYATYGGRENLDCTRLGIKMTHCRNDASKIFCIKASARDVICCKNATFVLFDIKPKRVGG
jgi:hypothetical protein